MPIDERRSAVDRGLTIGGRGRQPGGELAESTKAVYAGLFASAQETARRRLGRRLLPATPETLAVLVEHLIGEDVPLSTIRVTLTAIRWRHRIAGESVPDLTAAWYVLRCHDPNPRWTIAAVQPLRRVAYVSLVSQLDPARALDARDRCLIACCYAVGASDEVVCGVRRADVTATGGGVQVQLPGRAVSVEHDAPDDPLTCPACLIGQWDRWIGGRGAPADSPLLRSVDKGSNISGVDPLHAGPIHPGGALSHRSYLKVIRRAAERTGFPLPPRLRASFALRLGGALDARLRGETRGQVAVRVGLDADGITLMRYLSLVDG